MCLSLSNARVFVLGLSTIAHVYQLPTLTITLNVRSSFQEPLIPFQSRAINACMQSSQTVRPTWSRMYCKSLWLAENRSGLWLIYFPVPNWRTNSVSPSPGAILDAVNTAKKSYKLECPTPNGHLLPPDLRGMLDIV